jgi:signal transduction histidine kinase/ligand-binding sensor domain-containing protein
LKNYGLVPALLLAMVLQAQPINKTTAFFRHIESEDGAGSVNAWEMVEDIQGRVWAGTSDGLYLISNHSTVRYTREDGLNTNNIISLYADSSGKLLLGTIKGLTVFANGRFSSVASFPETIVRQIHKAGSLLYVATPDKIFRLNPGDLSILDTISLELKNHYIKRFYIISDRQMLIGTTNGLFLWSAGKLDKMPGLGKVAIWGLRQVNNVIYAMTEKGVYSVDAANRSTTPRFAMPKGITTSVNDIVYLPDRNVYWVGSWGNGILEYKDNRFVKRYDYQSGFSGQYVHRFLQTGKMDIWMATYGSGIIYRRKSPLAFIALQNNPDLSKHMHFTRTINNDYLVWGKDNRAIALNQNTSSVFAINSVPGKIRDFVYRDNVYYAISENGLFSGKSLQKLNKSPIRLKGKPIRFLSNPEFISVLTTSTITIIHPLVRQIGLPADVYYSSTNKYYCTLFQGDYYFCGNSLPLLKISDYQITEFREPENTVFKGIESDARLAYIATGNGLYTYDGTTFKVRPEFAGKTIPFLAKSPTGRLWLGDDKGNVFGLLAGDTIRFDKKDLPATGQMIGAVPFDNSVFIYTRNGILQINEGTKLFRFYDLQKMLNIGLPVRIEKAVSNGKDILVLTNAGIVIVMPNKWVSAEQPMIDVARLHFPYEQRFQYIGGDAINLRHDNVFDIHLSAYAYGAGDNLFVYGRLFPFEQKYKRQFNHFQFGYKNLPRGQYQFQFYAMDYWGNKSTTGFVNLAIEDNRTTRLQILLLSIFGLILLIALIYMLTRHFRQKRQNFIDQQVQLQTADYTSELEMLKRDIRSKDNFFRSLTHDLKAAPRNILGLLRMIRSRTEYKSDEIEDLYERVANNARRSIAMVDDILNLTHMRNSTFPFEKISIPDLFEHIMKDLMQLGLASPFQVNYDLRLKYIYAERKKLRTILQNLIENAIKYRHPDRPLELTIETRRRKDEYFFIVCDNGIGIPEKQVKNIFDIHFRGTNFDKETIEGRGVGLAAVKQLVEAYKGIIEVASAQNGGSTFTICLSRTFLESQRHHKDDANNTSAEQQENK